MLVFVQSNLLAKTVAFFYDVIVIQKSSSGDGKFPFCGLGYYFPRTLSPKLCQILQLRLLGWHQNKDYEGGATYWSSKWINNKQGSLDPETDDIPMCHCASFPFCSLFKTACILTSLLFSWWQKRKTPYNILLCFELVWVGYNNCMQDVLQRSTNLVQLRKQITKTKVEKILWKLVETLKIHESRSKLPILVTSDFLRPWGHRLQSGIFKPVKLQNYGFVWYFHAVFK